MWSKEERKGGPRIIYKRSGGNSEGTRRKVGGKSGSPHLRMGHGVGPPNRHDNLKVIDEGCHPSSTRRERWGRNEPRSLPRRASACVFEPRPNPALLCRSKLFKRFEAARRDVLPAFFFIDEVACDQTPGQHRGREGILQSGSARGAWAIER